MEKGYEKGSRVGRRSLGKKEEHSTAGKTTESWHDRRYTCNLFSGKGGDTEFRFGGTLEGGVDGAYASRGGLPSTIPRENGAISLLIMIQANMCGLYDSGRRTFGGVRRDTRQGDRENGDAGRRL